MCHIVFFIVVCSFIVTRTESKKLSSLRNNSLTGVDIPQATLYWRNEVGSALGLESSEKEILLFFFFFGHSSMTGIKIYNLSTRIFVYCYVFNAGTKWRMVS